MLKKLIASLFLFLLLASIFARAAHAQSADLDALAKIYCEKRRGNQVNLETWYGGKCDPENPLNPDTIGFGDIIFIDLYTKLTGEGDFEGIDWTPILRSLFGLGDAGYKTKEQILADVEKIEKLTATTTIIAKDPKVNLFI